MSRRENNKGIVLVLSLAVITILAVIVLEFNYLTRVDLDIANNYRDDLRSGYLAKSAINFVIALLRDDDDFSYDCLKDDWARQMPSTSAFGGRILLRTVDEASKININQINLKSRKDRVKQQIERLLRLLGKDTVLVEKILQEAPFKTIGQFTNDVDLIEYFTVVTEGKVNINTASCEVIEALSSLMTRSLAQGIVEFRKDHPFKDVTQLSPAYEYKKPLGITQEIYDDIKDLITVRSHLFLVQAQAQINQASYNIDAIIRRDGKICKIIYWQEG